MNLSCLFGLLGSAVPGTTHTEPHGDKPEHVHEFNRWNVLIRQWQCICGATKA